MTLLVDRDGRKKLPFAGDIGDDVRITLKTAEMIGDMLAAQENGGFCPWLDWNLPFTNRFNAGSVKSDRDILHEDTISFLNDAYKILNLAGRETEIHNLNVSVSDIEPNPFWDMEADRLFVSRVKFWAIVIKKADIESRSHCIMAVRPCHGKYQAINHHHQLAALRLLHVETITVPVLELTDDQMEKHLSFEKF